jgi:DNA replication and repair protein RecF
MDSVISQYDKQYLEHLTRYNALLKQRNALLKQYEEHPIQAPAELFEVLELQMAELGIYIYQQRTDFINRFTPAFQEMYSAISGDSEQVSLQYTSQLQERNLIEAFARTRQRDLAIGWTTQGIHKDELDMRLGEYPLKRVGSQGQQKSYLLAMKLGQAIFLGKPILLLDDIFDKLDQERVERIIQLVSSHRFGQIFITDTDRQHLTAMLEKMPKIATVFQVKNGQFNAL